MNLKISPTLSLKILFQELDKYNKDEPTHINCGYYDLSTPIPNSGVNNHVMFHLNLASLGLHKDTFFFNCTKFLVLAVQQK